MGTKTKLFIGLLLITSWIGLLNSCKDSSTSNKPNESPTVTFSITPTEGIMPHEVTVSVTGTDSDGSIASYHFDADGDGTAEITQSSPIDQSYTYETEGAYSATAWTTDQDGKSSRKQTVEVLVESPDHIAPGNINPNAERAGYGKAKVEATASGDDGNEGTLSNLEIYARQVGSQDSILAAEARDLQAGQTITETIDLLQTGAVPGEEVIITAYGTDNAGNTSSSSQPASVITPGHTRNIQVVGASPEPNEGLVPVANAYVVTQDNNGNQLVVQTNGNGEITLEDVIKGNFTTTLKDEQKSKIGDWHDIKPQNTTINNDTNELYALWPNIALHPDDNVYNNSLELAIALKGENLYTVPVTGHNASGYPFRVWYTQGDATQEQFNWVKEGLQEWNKNGHNNLTFPTDSTNIDLHISFSDTIKTPNGDEAIFHRDFEKGIYLINPNKITREKAAKDIAAGHEMTHWLDLNLNEIYADPYCSKPGARSCINGPTNTELGILETFKVIRNNLGNNYNMLIYEQHN